MNFFLICNSLYGNTVKYHKKDNACLEPNVPQKQVNLPHNTTTFNLGVGWGKDKVY